MMCRSEYVCTLRIPLESWTSFFIRRKSNVSSIVCRFEQKSKLVRFSALWGHMTAFAMMSKFPLLWTLTNDDNVTAEETSNNFCHCLRSSWAVRTSLSFSPSDCIVKYNDERAESSMMVKQRQKKKKRRSKVSRVSSSNSKHPPRRHHE